MTDPMDTNKVHTLLDRHELGEIELTEREYRFLMNIAETEELGRDVWTKGQTAEVNRIYEEKGP